MHSVLTGANFTFMLPPPCLYNSQMYSENYSRLSPRNFNHPSMANTTLVLTGPHMTNGLSTLWNLLKGTLFLQKLPRFSWPPGGTAQRNNIKSTLRRCSSYSSPKVNEALDLLMVLYNKGLTYSTINTCSKVCSFIHHYSQQRGQIWLPPLSCEVLHRHL